MRTSRIFAFFIASSIDFAFGDDSGDAGEFGEDSGECYNCACGDATQMEVGVRDYDGRFTVAECSSFCSTNITDYVERLVCDDSFSNCYCDDGCTWLGIFGDPDSSKNCTGTGENKICTSERNRNCQIFCAENQCGDSVYSLWGTADCLGGETLLYSCNAGMYLPAKSISIGDSIRTALEDGSVCSEVYYVLKHEGKSLAYTISFADDTTGAVVVVSPNHLVYVGESFSSRRVVRAKNIRPGDLLISKDGPKQVLSIDTTYSELVNVLTYNPSLELVNGVIISAHSYHETLYSYLFWPLQMMSYLFGAERVEAFYDSMLLPVLGIVDRKLVQPAVFMLSEL